MKNLKTISLSAINGGRLSQQQCDAGWGTLSDGTTTYTFKGC